MEKLKLLIVEDELIIAEDMKIMLEEIGYIVSGIAISFDEAVDNIELHNPDMVMIDINLVGGKDGIELAQYINQHSRTPFIFTTSYADKNTIERAKDTHPYAYLIKPFEKKNLFSSIEIALSNAKSESFIKELPESSQNNEIYKDVFFVKKDNYFVKIKSKDIQYVKADGNYLDLVCGEEKFIIRSTLKTFYEQLPVNQFQQVHKSYIVNLEEIDAIAYDHVLIGEAKIPISKTARESLVEITQRFT